jgi:hypothetical protein
MRIKLANGGEIVTADALKGVCKRLSPNGEEDTFIYQAFISGCSTPLTIDTDEYERLAKTIEG